MSPTVFAAFDVDCHPARHPNKPRKAATKMDYLRILRALCVGLSAVGLLLPTSVLEAASPGALANDVKPREALVNDVELDAAGSSSIPLAQLLSTPSHTSVDPGLIHFAQVLQSVSPQVQRVQFGKSFELSSSQSS